MVTLTVGDLVTATPNYLASIASHTMLPQKTEIIHKKAVIIGCAGNYQAGQRLWKCRLTDNNKVFYAFCRELKKLSIRRALKIGDQVATTTEVTNLDSGRTLRAGTRAVIEYRDDSDGLYYCRSMNHKASFWLAANHLKRS